MGPLFSAPILKKLVIIAVPSILQQSFISVGNIIIQGVINGFGVSVMAGLKLVWMLCIPLVFLYFLTGRWLLYFFVGSTAGSAIHTGILFLRILSSFYFVVSAKLVADGILRGAEMMNKFMVSTFTDLILRVVLASTLSRTFLASAGIWMAWPIGWIIATVLSILFYRTGSWKNQIQNQKESLKI